VRQNLMLGIKDPPRVASGRWSIDDMYALFPRLKERDGTPGGVLSGGEQQMLTLCRTLMGDPDLVMIDEPTEGLAPKIVELVGEFLQECEARHLHPAHRTEAGHRARHLRAPLPHGPRPHRLRRHAGRPGDRGGNGIPTRSGSLHSDWDEALRNQAFEDTLRRMVVTAQQADLRSLSLNPSEWLQESRRLLHDFVYPDEIKAAVLRSERLKTRMEGIVIDSDYLSRMQAISEDRVTLAAMRMIMVLGGPEERPFAPLTEQLQRETDALPPVSGPVN
jgi:hypothetical protein